MSKSVRIFIADCLLFLLGMRQRWWQARSSILSIGRAKYTWQSFYPTQLSYLVLLSTSEANYLWLMWKRRRRLGRPINRPFPKEKLQVWAFFHRENPFFADYDKAIRWTRLASGCRNKKSCLQNPCFRSCRCLCKAFQSVPSISKHGGQVCRVSVIIRKKDTFINWPRVCLTKRGFDILTGMLSQSKIGFS